MCTVIYYPGKNGPLFSSCRDEDPARAPALHPALYKANDTMAIYAKDTAAGGTWAGMNEEGHVIILLNGGFKKHERKQTYQKSRGLILKDLLFVADPLAEWRQYDLKNIEPFTLIIWSSKKLYECVWDGLKKHISQYDAAVPHCWSSSTLYDNAAQKLRRKWFTRGLEKDAIRDADSLQSFLLAHNDAANGFVMKRSEKVATLSITCFQLYQHQVYMGYNDLLNGSKEEVRLLVKNNITQ